MFYKPTQLPGQNCPGFTLPELMVAAALIGLVLTLTISLVLYAGDNRTTNTLASQAAQVVSNAYVRYQLNHVTKPATGLSDILTYAKVSKTPVAMAGIRVNAPYGDTERAYVECGAGGILCYQLQGGSVVWFDSKQHFEGTQRNNALLFGIDADGHYKADPNAPQSVELLLYFDGRLYTWRDIRPDTILGGSVVSPDETKVPDWFKW